MCCFENHGQDMSKNAFVQEVAPLQVDVCRYREFFVFIYK